MKSKPFWIRVAGSLCIARVSYLDYAEPLPTRDDLQLAPFVDEATPELTASDTREF
jgi:hypothetical protein